MSKSKKIVAIAALIAFASLGLWGCGGPKIEGTWGGMDMPPENDIKYGLARVSGPAIGEHSYCPVKVSARTPKFRVFDIKKADDGYIITETCYYYNAGEVVDTGEKTKYSFPVADSLYDLRGRRNIVNQQIPYYNYVFKMEKQQQTRKLFSKNSSIPMRFEPYRTSDWNNKDEFRFFDLAQATDNSLKFTLKEGYTLTVSKDVDKELKVYKSKMHDEITKKAKEFNQESVRLITGRRSDLYNLTDEQYQDLKKHPYILKDVIFKDTNE